MGALETIHGDFNPRPPRGGRQDFTAYHLANFDISIHALREEGDLTLNYEDMQKF